MARALAISWSLFLAWVTLGQGFETNHYIFGIWLVQGEFHLETSEFIAVVTTTTATVFGFLVIVTRHLFSGPSA